MANKRTAGFAVVTSIAANAVNGFLAAATAAVTMPSFTVPNLVTVDGTQVGLSGSVALAAPRVSFTANAGNLIDLALSATGTIQLTADGADLLEVQVTLSTSLSVPPVVDLTPLSLSIGLDPAGTSASFLEVSVLYGPPLPSVYQKALADSKVLAKFNAALHAIPASALTFTVPGAAGTFTVDFNGFKVGVDVSDVVVVPLDGVLDVASDVSPYTSGVAAELVNLITAPSPSPLYFEYGNDGYVTGPDGYTFGGHGGDGVNLAAAIDSDFLCAVVNGPASQQLSGSLLAIDPDDLPIVYTVVAGDTPDKIAEQLYKTLTTYNVQQWLQYGSITVSRSGAKITMTGPISMLSPTITAQVTPPFGSPPHTAVSETAQITGDGPPWVLEIGGTATPGDQITLVIPIGGVAISNVSLAAQGAVAQPGTAAPNLPSNIYPCLTLTLEGNLLYFGPEPSTGTPPPPDHITLNESSISFTFSISLCPIMIYGQGSPYCDIVMVSWSLSVPDLTAIGDLFPLGPFLFKGAINGAVDTYIGGQLFPDSSTTMGLSGSTPVPGSPQWTTAFNVLGVVVFPPQNDPAAPGGELATYIAVSTTGPAPAAGAFKAPAFALSADDSHSLTSLAPIPVQLSVSNVTSLLDPALGIRIAWNAKRNDTSAHVLHRDTPFTAAATTIAVQRADGPTGDLVYNDTWTVTCKVYRPADALMPEFVYYEGSLRVGLTDVVDRHHPYVFWAPREIFLDPGFPTMHYPDGKIRKVPAWRRQRRTRIHRTDLLIRCIEVPVISAHNHAPEYLDSLEHNLKPLGYKAGGGSEDTAERWRHGVLCDYCFYGGPTRTILKTPTAPTPKWV
ncbi:hypothetical protein KDL01_17645 [Actinospica durhamensis]|uniref:Uncharacterized protein n=1 Tax=Actinospica durhamensis TaxID=1508375 RepID=A0A941EQ55_9ACTN|nr:hypothetical protein [Actinospica durhamensis]MBR7835103.1 hypothetical protein [Actinospica durhamensis]